MNLNIDTMKRWLLTVSLMNLCLLANAQFFNPYVQLSGGLTVDHKNTGAVCLFYEHIVAIGRKSGSGALVGVMDYPDDSSLEYTLTTKSYLGMLGSFKVSYEYQLTPKMVLGTYFGGTFYPSIGLLIRGNI